MKKKVLCIALALLLCLLGAMPTFADGEEEAQQNREAITVSFALEHVSGSTYRMWAKILNPGGVTVDADLVLLTAGFTVISSCGATSSNHIFNFSKNVSLPSSGTYYLRLIVQGNNIHETMQKTYFI